MQNIDFTARIQRGGPWRGGRIESAEARPVVATPALPIQDDVKRRNRTLAVWVAALILAFTGGLVAGIQLGRLKAMDENVVRYPDGGARRPVAATDAGVNRPAEGSASGGSPAPAPAASGDDVRRSTDGVALSNLGGAPAGGRFLIKVGSFASDEAERLAARVNALPEFGAATAQRCRNVRETDAPRKLAFRTAAEGSRDVQNVFLGCFSSSDQARDALEKLRSSGVPGVSGARLYEIE
jgi:hypothetical protein